MKNNFNLSDYKFSKKWIIMAVTIIGWSLFEEIIISLSDLIVNIFANHINYSTGSVFNFLKHANVISNWDWKSLGLEKYNGYGYRSGQFALNAISAQNQIFIISISILFGFAYGIGIYTSQYFGSKKFQNLKDLVAFKIEIGLLISLIILIIVEVWGYKIIYFIISPNYAPLPSSDLNWPPKDTPQTIAEAKNWINYLDYKAKLLSVEQGVKFGKISVIGYPILAINLAFITTLRETARPFISFICSFFSIFFTIFFCFIFIVPPHFLHFKGLGILGCSLSFLLGVILQTVFIFFILLFKRYEIIPNRFFGFNKIVIWLSFKKSFIIALNELFWSFSIFMQVKLISMSSIDALTANSIFFIILSIVVTPIYHGLAAGTSVLISNNLGKNNLIAAWEHSKKILLVSVFLGIITMVILECGSFLIPFLFSNTSRYDLNLAKSFVQIFGLVSIPWICTGSLYSLIRSGGNVKIAFASDSLYNWMLTIPVAAIVILVVHLDIIYVFIIIRMLDCFKLSFSLFFYLRKKWLNNLVIKLPDSEKSKVNNLKSNDIIKE